jgi:hypothetical protein
MTLGSQAEGRGFEPHRPLREGPGKRGGSSAKLLQTDVYADCGAGVPPYAGRLEEYPCGGDERFPLQGSTVALACSGGYTSEWIAEDLGHADGTSAPLATSRESRSAISARVFRRGISLRATG